MYFFTFFSKLKPGGIILYIIVKLTMKCTFDCALTHVLINKTRKPRYHNKHDDLLAGDRFNYKRTPNDGSRE